jgi:hypothetical protein
MEPAKTGIKKMSQTGHRRQLGSKTYLSVFFARTLFLKMFT